MKTLKDQVFLVIRMLEARRYDLTTDIGKEKWTAAINWIKHLDGKLEVDLKRQLTHTVCSSFSCVELDIIRALEGGYLVTPNGYKAALNRDEKLFTVLPKGGWFEWYAKATEKTESPLSYHIFSSLSILGAALGRRVRKEMGWFNIYPNYCVILVGPTGIKKTSATDIAQSFVSKHVLCPIMADAITPEALATAMTVSGHHFIYAPELSSFFGKQRYNEGLIQRLLRLLDCPDEWKVSTQTRGEEVIYEPTVTMLGASTLSLMAGSTPGEVLSGGFLNRFLVVVENDSDRCFPNPEKPAQKHLTKLDEIVQRFKGYSGNMLWSAAADKAYDTWYRTRKQQLRESDDEATKDVMARTFNHTIRTAMLVHLAQCDSLTICETCFNSAAQMVAYVEESLPRTVRSFKQTQTSSESEYVVDQIFRAGGAIDHSSLVRKVSNRMNSAQLKSHLTTLKESGRVKETKQGMGRCYILQQEELTQ